ncbi:hypothetical protein R5R35_013935 [Gryllus longicercus]|uniref:Uncharacterized protein n=1 Tax=Gryllus longicercus TaxID=2509291 RepID=A0AAN9V1A2_9ORTH
MCSEVRTRSNGDISLSGFRRFSRDSRETRETPAVCANVPKKCLEIIVICGELWFNPFFSYCDFVIYW